MNVFKKIKELFNSKHQKPSNSSEMLEKILNGIPDVIGVYNTDHTIILYNQAGYDFHRTTPDGIKDKKCFEMLYGRHKCMDCPIDSAIELKRIVRKEKYIDKLDKFMEYCCNPVMDDKGNVLFIVEQLRDISKRKQLEVDLEESSKNYRKIVNLSPNSIVISMEGIIVLANQQALEFIREPIGEKLEKFILPDYLPLLKKGFANIDKEKADKFTVDCKMIVGDGNVAEVEISSSYFDYKGRNAVLSIIKDISERNKELNAAAEFQSMALQKCFPIPEKVEFKTFYLPAKTISGDFYLFQKVNEDIVLGIIIDVSGKGISAALCISAFKVLFYEAALATQNPARILKLLNKKVAAYLDERYIAACCFSFNFNTNEAQIVGAGINEFVIKKQNGQFFRQEVKGPFLGMFNDSIFEEQLVRFGKGDRFYFYSDGLEEAMQSFGTTNRFYTAENISEGISYLKEKVLTDSEKVKDDCTLLAIEIK